MNKPIVKLGVNDSSNITIEKSLTQRNIDGSFKDLLDYITDPREDELNPSYAYDEERRRLAERIKLWMREMNSSAADRAAFNLYYRDDQGNLSDPLMLEARVGDHIGRILKPGRMQTERGMTEYQQADLVFQYSPSGGR